MAGIRIGFSISERIDLEGNYIPNYLDYNSNTNTLNSILIDTNGGNMNTINVNDMVNLSGSTLRIYPENDQPVRVEGSILNRSARVLTKTFIQDDMWRLRLEFNPPISLIIRGENDILNAFGYVTKINSASAPAPAPRPAPAPAPRLAPAPAPRLAPAPAPRPAQGVIIPTIITEFTFVIEENTKNAILRTLNGYNQTTINRIALLLSLIYDITDSNGKKFGDAFAYNDVNGVKTYLHPAFRNTYKNLFGWLILNHLFFFIIGVRFIVDITNGAMSLNTLTDESMAGIIYLCSQVGDNPNIIIQFYRELFNRKDDIIEMDYEGDDSNEILGLLYNMLQSIRVSSLTGVEQVPYWNLIPRRVPAPVPAPAPAPATISNPPPAVELSKIISDLQYLTSLGLTARSDNETMKNTLRRYKEITGSDYFSPPPASQIDSGRILPNTGVPIRYDFTYYRPNDIAYTYNSVTDTLSTIDVIIQTNDQINVNDIVNVKIENININGNYTAINLQGIARVISKTLYQYSANHSIIRLQFNPPISINLDTPAQFFFGTITKVNQAILGGGNLDKRRSNGKSKTRKQ